MVDNVETKLERTLQNITEGIKNKSYRYAKDQTKYLLKLLGTKINANCSKKRPKDYDDLKNQIEMWFRNEWNEVKVLETSKKNGGNTHSLETIKMFYEVIG